MKKSWILWLVAIVVGCSSDPGSTAGKSLPEANQSLPNIVLIVSDDHGSRDAGCYGNPAIHTPNIDYLASEGVRFDNAYCTSPSCSASRSVILSGMYNHAIGHYGHEHAYNHFSTYDHVKSLPVYLEEYAGYRTGRVGKYHLGPRSVYRFQEVFQANGRNPVAMADEVQGFMDQKSPFFLYYCTNDPHRSREIVEDHPLKPNAFGNKDNGYPGVVQHTFTEDEVLVPPYLPDRPETRAELAQYYESVARMDQGVGRVIEHLKASSQWDNTIIIYISDNGIAFPGAKTNIYEAGIKLPCIVKLPESKLKGSATDAMISWADLTPTILDLAGVLPQAQAFVEAEYAAHGMDDVNNTYVRSFQGSSFGDVLRGDLEKDDTETFASHTFHEITMYYPMRSVISGDYKLIWNIAHGLPYPHAMDLYESATWQATLHSEDRMYAGRSVEDYSFRPAFELYNLAVDPQETRNLANDPDHADMLASMKSQIRTYQQETNDPWLSKWEHE